MQKYRFKVTLADGVEKTAEVDQRDIRKWESETERSWLTEDMSITSAAQIAYFGLKRAGEFSGSWEEFNDMCVWVEEVSDESANPTPTEVTDD